MSEKYENIIYILDKIRPKASGALMCHTEKPVRTGKSKLLPLVVWVHTIYS